MTARWRTRVDRVFGLVAKELRHVLRDPRMARVIFVAPIIQLIVFGYAVSTDLADTPTFVVDRDGTSASRELVAAVTASRYFAVVGGSARPADLVRALEHGDALVGLDIPEGFGRDLGAGRPTRVQVLLDGTSSNTATVAQGYLDGIVRAHAAGLAGPAAGGGGGGGIDLRARAWYNPSLVSRDYNVPAVVGALILLVCLLLTSLAVVREREVGTLEQLRVSPLTAGELIAGKTLPFAAIGLFDLVLVTAVAVGWFGIPFRGSPPLLLLASVLYLSAGLGAGLLISTISRTQQEAFLATFLVFMPTILLSGFMFPVESMPRIFQDLTLINPMRHYVEIVRALFLKGTDLAVLWPQYAALAAIGGGLFTAAVLAFRRSEP